MSTTCKICLKLVDNLCKSILCDSCDTWIHFQDCSGLSSCDFEILSHSDQKWTCLKCWNTALPFFESYHKSCKSKPNTKVTSVPNENVKNVISQINHVISQYDDDTDCIDFNSTNCKYYECSDFNNLNLNPKAFSSLHLNIASMAKHFDELNTLLATLKHDFSVIGISETRFIKGHVPNFDFNIDGYHCIHTPTESSAGGSLLYISKHYTQFPRHDLDTIMYQGKLLESTFAEISFAKKTNLIVGTIYRHPCMSVETFNREFLSPLLHKISSEKKQILLLGDFNINLLNSTDEDTGLSAFMDILGSHLILPQILLPTRVTAQSKTLIDNIFFSVNGQSTTSGNLIHLISDHLPQFCVLNDHTSNPEKNDIYFHNWSKFDQENFILDYLDTDWGHEFRAPGPIDPNTCFDIFYSKIQQLLSKHLPTGKLTKRQLKTQQKPWITSAILKSISKRDFYFRKFSKAKDPMVKSEWHELFKRYRNTIVTLCRQSKSNFYRLLQSLFK